MSKRGPRLLAVSSAVYPFFERGQGAGLRFLTPGDWVRASREPSNECDPNAVLLYDDSHKDLGYIGYLESPVAASLVPKLRQGWGAFFLLSAAYLRDDGQWTVEAMVFAFHLDDYEVIRGTLDTLSDQLRADRFAFRYRLKPESPGEGLDGLGFSLVRQGIPAANDDFA